MLKMTDRVTNNMCTELNFSGEATNSRYIVLTEYNIGCKYYITVNSNNEKKSYAQNIYDVRYKKNSVLDQKISKDSCEGRDFKIPIPIIK